MNGQKERDWLRARDGKMGKRHGKGKRWVEAAIGKGEEKEKFRRDVERG